MTARTIVYGIFAIIGAAIVLANWAILSTAVDLSLFAATVRVPIYVLLILAAAIVLLVDAALEAGARRRWMRERHQLLTERDQARSELANEEASRIGTLRTDLQAELAAIRTDLDRLTEGQRVLLDEIPALRELDAHGKRRIAV